MLRFICHTSNISIDDICGCEFTPCDLITTVLLRHVHHTRNFDTYGTEHKSFEFIRNEVQMESFFCCAKYINACQPCHALGGNAAEDY